MYHSLSIILQLKKNRNLRIFLGEVLPSTLDNWKFDILVWSKKLTIYFISIFFPKNFFLVSFQKKNYWLMSKNLPFYFCENNKKWLFFRMLVFFHIKKKTYASKIWWIYFISVKRVNKFKKKNKKNLTSSSKHFFLQKKKMGWFLDNNFQEKYNRLNHLRAHVQWKDAVSCL